MEYQKVESKPMGKVNIWRMLLSKIPFHCSYCGKLYVGCHSDDINTIFPLPQNGRCCPDGHEGYTKEFIGLAGFIYKKFENIK